MKIPSAITILSVLVVQQVVMASSGSSKALGAKRTKLIEQSGVLSVPSRLFTDTTGKANKSTKKARNLQSKAIKGAEAGTYLSISTLSLPSLEEDGVEDDRGIRNEPSLNLSEKLSNDEPAYGYHVLQPKTTKTKATSSHRNLSGKAIEALSFPLDVNGSLLLDEDVAGGYHVFNTAKTPKGEKKIASRKLGKAEKESYGKAEKGYHGYQVGSILY